MNAFIKIVFYIGFLFFGGGFLVALCQYIGYNGFWNFFEYVQPESLETKVEIDSLFNNKTIFYTYAADGRKYESKQTVKVNYINKYEFYETNVFYNKTIPSLSYVGKKELKLRSPISGMMIFGFFFIFFFLIYRFIDIDKWIGVYTRGEYKNSRKK